MEDTVIAWMLIAIPLGFAVALPFVSKRSPISSASLAAHAGFGLACASACVAVLSGRLHHSTPPMTRVTLGRLVAVDSVTLLVMALVTFIALVVVRYTRRYLAGDPGQARFVRSLLATLAGITTLALSNNLLLLAVAWTLTSVALHRLLTFYRERPQALVAAHKKFLLSRLADLGFLGAVILIGSETGTLAIDEINAWAQTRAEISVQLHVAALLLALVVILKSAQMPFHGWLIQVMEAPTPVSALLHAGIVNLGGYVLVRLAPLFGRAAPAQSLLVVVGTTTAVIAALVMTTRVSVKVALAWSTCAQMGFMLVECGLGAWDLALLHLTAHSLYKAHAFLGSGNTVDAWRARALGPSAGASPSILRVLATFGLLLTSIGAAAGVAVEVGWLRPTATLAFTVAGLAASLVPLLVRGSVGSLGPLVARGTLFATLFFASHAAAGWVLAPVAFTAGAFSWSIAILGFLVLLGVQIALVCRPKSLLARALHPVLFGGLYLDEVFTRFTLRVWPLRRAPRTAQRPPIPLGSTAEVL